MRAKWLVVVALGVAWARGGTSRDDLVALRASLAAQRTLGRSAGWAAELSFAAAHKAEPALAAEVMYDVALSQRQDDRSTAAKTLERLLAAFPKVQPWAALATYELARAYADRSSTQAKAIERYTAFLKSDLPDPVRRADATMGLARLYQAAGKYAQALAAYQAFVEQFPDRLRQCAEAVAGLGRCHVELKHPAEAQAALDRLAKDFPWATKERQDLLLSLAQALRTAEDAERAIPAYEKLLEDLPRSDPRRSQAYMGLAMLHVQKGEREKAAEVYRRMGADRALNPSYRASAYQQLFDLERRAGDHAAVIRLAYKLIAAQPSALLQSGSVLGELVDALVDEGREDEALPMARAYCRIASLAAALHTYGGSSSALALSQAAVLAVVRALKAKEGSLRPASRFIAFIEHGPEGPDGKLGTDDDTPDPTAGHTLPPNAERDKLFEAAARRFVGQPYELGFLYLCWDRPDDALRAFRRHYLECNDAAGLRRAATLLAQAMRAVGRPEADVDAFFDFQNYGPAGKDGKPNTNDDLKDPILAPRK